MSEVLSVSKLSCCEVLVKMQRILRAGHLAYHLADHLAGHLANYLADD